MLETNHGSLNFFAVFFIYIIIFVVPWVLQKKIGGSYVICHMGIPMCPGSDLLT